jgi:CheY-like chemotaxis protein/anti-sigma regulatory factor (Ser/Thr protein kinase)
VFEGNESQLQQVFMNLLSNAFKATQKANRTVGDIHIQANLESDNRLFISISDNGCGVDKNIQPFIFDPFFTTESKGKGTGLGLAIVERIVAAHNGEIRLQSEEGEGSTFQLWFDKVYLKERLDEPSFKPLPKAHSDQHIVVIDDDAAVLNVWTELLQFKDYQVTSFLDSKKALDFCSQTEAKIDCIFTDFDMPNLNGEHFCEALRQVNQSVKIIMATGYSEVLSEEKITQLKIAKLLYKPIAFDEFLRQVDQVMEGADTG